MRQLQANIRCRFGVPKPLEIRGMITRPNGTNPHIIHGRVSSFYDRSIMTDEYSDAVDLTGHHVKMAGRTYAEGLAVLQIAGCAGVRVVMLVGKLPRGVGFIPSPRLLPSLNLAAPLRQGFRALGGQAVLAGSSGAFHQVE